MEDEKKTGQELSKQSSAERAREKRKASVEEAARKQAEKEARRAAKKANESKAHKRARILLPICIILLALLIFFGWFFGFPNRAFTAVKVADGSKVNVAEYEYYYRSLYNYYSNMSQQYESYYGSYYGTGAGAMVTGFDHTKTPANQKFTAPAGSDLSVDKSYGKEPTWADYFEQTSIETAQKYTATYNLAKKAGYKMSKAEKRELSDFIEDLRQTAADNNYSLDAYLRTNYGRGMTEGLLKKIYEKQTVAGDFLKDKQNEYADKVSEDDITAEYKANPQDYTKVSLRYFSFSPELTADDKTKDEEITKANQKLKAKADAMLEKATADNFSSLAVENAAEDYKSYYEDNDTYTTMADASYETISGSVSKKAADWAYSADTKVGDKKVFAVKADTGLKSYFVLLKTKMASKDNTYPVSIRQILYMVSDDAKAAEGSESTTHTDAEAKKLAQDTLSEWKNSSPTDAHFAELATAKTEDTGSAENGGLYENVTPTSSYVPEFLDWCFEAGRKVGDTGIIKTDYGYHIMYMKEIAKEPVWKSTIREQLSTKAYTDYENSITKADSLAEASGHWTKRVRSRVEKFAERVIANMNASNSTAGADSMLSAENIVSDGSAEEETAAAE